MAVSVVEAAWRAAGRPDHDLGPTKAAGVCDLTGEPGPVWPATSVVSDLFTDWDRCRFRAPGRATVFGHAAVWSFRTRPLRQRAHLLRAVWAEAPTETLRSVLSCALAPDCVVVVPISRQKHCLPFAVWGHVATDGRTVPWSADDGARLGTLVWLRAAGASERTIHLEQPPWPIVKGIGALRAGELMERWAMLDPWRHDAIYLDIACRATRTPKESE